MTPIRFHRQLSRSIYIWGVFTPRDFGTLIGLLSLDMMLLNSNLGIVAVLILYPAYLLLLRVGRPAGYDVHLARSLFAPRILLPGRSPVAAISHDLSQP